MAGRPPPLAVYVHLPWCVSKCPYCDFNSHTYSASASLDDYVRALATDLVAESREVRGREVQTVFIGGGTPSLFPAEKITAILASLRAQLTVSADAEITMEANPGTVERGALSAYRDAGVTRLSLGAQSFDAELLQRLGRIHGPDDVRAACDEALQAGFDSINLDLMFALPGQTAEQARHDVGEAIRTGMAHISYYHLTLEPNTVFFARPPADLPDDDRAYALHEASLEQLAAAGYERYEVSAFGLPGHACRHNLNYWSFGDYLGLGAGAHGKITDASGRIRRTRKTAHPAAYLAESRAGDIRRHENVPGDADILFEFMLNVLRLEAGFSTRLFTERTGLPAATLLPRLEAASAGGLLEALGSDRWRPTELGFRFLNDLQAQFLPVGDESDSGILPAPGGRGSAAVMHKTQS